MRRNVAFCCLQPASMSIRLKSTTKFATFSSDESDRVVLARAIRAVTDNEVRLADAVAQLKMLSGSMLTSLDEQIDTKKKEFEEHLYKQEQRLKDEEIKLRQGLKEKQLEGATAVLAELQMVAVKKEDYEKTLQELSKVKSELDQRIQKAADEEREKAKLALDTAVLSQELKHKADMAQLKAASEQSAFQVKTLHELALKWAVLSLHFWRFCRFISSFCIYCCFFMLFVCLLFYIVFEVYMFLYICFSILQDVLQGNFGFFEPVFPVSPFPGVHPPFSLLYCVQGRK